ncbi:hypothetical protein ACLOJK_008365 [Asimina triloba]
MLNAGSHGCRRDPLPPRQGSVDGNKRSRLARSEAKTRAAQRQRQPRGDFFPDDDISDSPPMINGGLANNRLQGQTANLRWQATPMADLGERDQIRRQDERSTRGSHGCPENPSWQRTEGRSGPWQRHRREAGQRAGGAAGGHGGGQQQRERGCRLGDERVLRRTSGPRPSNVQCVGPDTNEQRVGGDFMPIK